VGRDTSKDRSGDQATWRDLVARLELPPAIDHASAPWPDRESLTPPEPDPASSAIPGLAESSARQDAQDPPAELDGTRSESGKQSPANRSRVIRPASFPHFPVPDGQPRADEETFATDTYLDFPDDGVPDEDEGYVPPYVPPQPKLDPVARGAWTALFGGPGYLFIATTLGWQVPRWAELAAIIAFIAGFVILVSRLGDGPSRRDGPDQGAVV
jgi:hypothetical protein